MKVRLMYLEYSIKKIFNQSVNYLMSCYNKLLFSWKESFVEYHMNDCKLVISRNDFTLKTLLFNLENTSGWDNLDIMNA